jgi:hypothetical protein
MRNKTGSLYKRRPASPLGKRGLGRISEVSELHKE